MATNTLASNGSPNAFLSLSMARPPRRPMMPLAGHKSPSYALIFWARIWERPLVFDRFLQKRGPGRPLPLRTQGTHLNRHLYGHFEDVTGCGFGSRNFQQGGQNGRLAGMLISPTPDIVWMDGILHHLGNPRMMISM